ncbi:MAG: hypothetical protein KatS3mg060_2548 [Dehalococcoidia bacterium]|jgi:hypothetical protein|nr:MAG: hypothetical protein KatS3mg060_2548 [Dehalococcoidia bacterium]
MLDRLRETLARHDDHAVALAVPQIPGSDRPITAELRDADPPRTIRRAPAAMSAAACAGRGANPSRRLVAPIGYPSRGG